MDDLLALTLAVLHLMAPGCREGRKAAPRCALEARAVVDASPASPRARERVAWARKAAGRLRRAVARDQEAPDGFLLVSLFAAESGFDPKAVNPVTGARGLGQVMPASASEAVLGWQRVARGEQVDPRRLDDPAFNLRVALKILAGFRARCGTWPETIGAYNGSGCRRTEFAARVWQRYLEIRPAVLASR